MANLYETLGREVERREEAEQRATIAFGALQGLCQTIMKIKIGEVSLDDLNIEVSDTHASWQLVEKDKK